MLRSFTSSCAAIALLLTARPAVAQSAPSSLDPLFSASSASLTSSAVAAPGCTSEVDVIFYVDNSGSVDNTEFDGMSTSIRNVVDYLMPAAGGIVRAAVVHYGSPAESWESNIYLESDFTDDPAVVKGFARRTGDLGIEDYAAESLILVGDALDGVANPHILSPQKKLTRRPGVPLVVFFFTDAGRQYWGTSVVLPAGAPDVFQPWNDFKSKRGAKFVSVVVPWAPGQNETVHAAAAIASVGGDYTGAIDPNPYDPEGDGVLPRWNFSASFVLSGSEIQRIAEGICHLGKPVLSTTLMARSSDATWRTTPDITTAYAGGNIDYRLQVENQGNVALTKTVLLDILPHPGDKGVVLSTSARGTAWLPALSGAVTAPAGVTVYYSTAGNPARDELTPGLPAGASAPAWTTTLPADPATVRSIKLEFTTLTLAPGDVATITWSTRAPGSGFTENTVAWNSAGFTAVNAATSGLIGVAETSPCGVVLSYPPGARYGDYVWMDADGDGIQESGEAGVGGVRVELYRDNGDATANMFSDTRVSTTRTGTDGRYLFTGLTAGTYFAVVMPGENYGFTLPNATVDDVDSDAISMPYGAARAGIMPLVTLGATSLSLTQDAGLTDRSGIPAVWAIVPLDRGRSLLGGRFRGSHGIPRNNIVLVDLAGVPDPKFAPGSAFNGVVRSLAVNRDGRILAGGEFTSFNGVASPGFAILSATGARQTGYTVPAQASVRSVIWAGASSDEEEEAESEDTEGSANSSVIYAGGEFSAWGGTGVSNLVRLDSKGKLDPTFRPVLNDRVNAVAANSDGRLYAAGAFTSCNGTAASRVVRLNADGSIDKKFNTGDGVNGEIFDIKLIGDDLIVLAGAFTSYKGRECNGIIRVRSNGSVDMQFLKSSLQVNSINTAN